MSSSRVRTLSNYARNISTPNVPENGYLLKKYADKRKLQQNEAPSTKPEFTAITPVPNSCNVVQTASDAISKTLNKDELQILDVSSTCRIEHGTGEIRHIQENGPSGKCPIIRKFQSVFTHLRNGSFPDKYVGLADLPNQIFRYHVIKGFNFNLMIVGESGLGKSTFINNLFSADMYTSHPYSEKTPPILRQTMSIESSCISITENGINLNLTLVDTPGFGDGIDNSTCWDSISSYINSKYDDYLKWEGSANRSPIQDTRVHACLYFISPTGHRLKPLDIEFLKRIHERVTIIPVIAKSDTLCKNDLTQFKGRIIDDLKLNGIKTYDFPQAFSQDEDDRDSVKSLIGRIPFAIVSSNTVIESGGKPIRVRKYPWGVCEVENLDHCDFVALRDLLLRTSLCHLIELTHTVLYEKYRSLKLGVSGSGDSIDGGILESLDSERTHQAKKLEDTRKMYQDMYNARSAELTKQLDEFENELKKKGSTNDSLGKSESLNDKDSKNSEDAQENSKPEDPSSKKKTSKKKLF